MTTLRATADFHQILHHSNLYIIENDIAMRRTVCQRMEIRIQEFAFKSRIYYICGSMNPSPTRVLLNLTMRCARRCGRKGIVRGYGEQNAGNQRIVPNATVSPNMRPFGAQRALGSASHSISNHHWARWEGSVRLGVWERVLHTPELQRCERRVLLQRSRQRLGPLIADQNVCTANKRK